MQNSVEKQIVDLESSRYQAMKLGDVAALDELLSPDLVYTHSDGSQDDKISYLSRVENGHFIYHAITHEITRIVLRADTAVVLGRMQADVSVAGSRRYLDNASLAVWAREEAGHWRFLAYQPTPRPKN